MYAIILYPLLTVAFFYLGAHAVISKPLWSRYPAWLDKLTLCAACSGMWYGLIVGAGGCLAGQPFLGLAPHPFTVIVIGLCSMVWTPLLAAKFFDSLERIPKPQDPSA